jgi:hypothetical protein
MELVDADVRGSIGHAAMFTDLQLADAHFNLARLHERAGKPKDALSPPLAASSLFPVIKIPREGRGHFPGGSLK